MIYEIQSNPALPRASFTYCRRLFVANGSFSFITPVNATNAQ